MAALGVGTLAAAVIVLVPTVIAIGITSAREVLVGPDWWRNRIALFLTFALLGGPVWSYYWFSMQRWAARGGPEERASLPRRVPRKTVTVLIGEGGGPFVRSLEGVLEGRVRILHRTDPDAGLPELAD